MATGHGEATGVADGWMDGPDGWAVCMDGWMDGPDGWAVGMDGWDINK
jgi:hypothetical protein